MSSSWNYDYDNVPDSPSTSDTSLDEDDVNYRMSPRWDLYDSTLRSRGFRLETVRDAKEFYKCRSKLEPIDASWLETLRAYERQNDHDLCHDPGLGDNLFRGFRMCDNSRTVIKAVHRQSRECDVIRYLSTPSRRSDPMNHTIPVLDMIEVDSHDLVLIVMEEWSPQLITDSPCCLRVFLAALRQIIEHIVFMHHHHIVHLDISLRNLLTDYKGHYAYIDFEISRRYIGECEPSIYGYRGTEIPPECEQGGQADPYKIDVWSLAVLILRACKLTGYELPQLMHVLRPMLHEDPHRRPSICYVLQAFDRMVSQIPPSQLALTCYNVH